MFKVFSGISIITTLFMAILLIRGYYTDINAWIAFVSALFNAILFTALDMLKTKVEQQSNDIKWLDGELSKIKSQLSDTKKKN